jgi:hypothetical protein
MDLDRRAVRTTSEFSDDGKIQRSLHEQSDDGAAWRLAMDVTLRKIDQGSQPNGIWRLTWVRQAIQASSCTRSFIGRRGRRRSSRRASRRAVDDGEVRSGWQYGELGGRIPGAVAIDAAADKSENLHRVLGPHDVGIAKDDQRRGGDRLNVSGRPALELAVELIAFPDESPPVSRI